METEQNRSLVDRLTNLTPYRLPISASRMASGPPAIMRGGLLCGAPTQWLESALWRPRVSFDNYRPPVALQPSFFFSAEPEAAYALRSDGPLILPRSIPAGFLPVDALLLEAEGDNQLSIRKEPAIAVLSRRARIARAAVVTNG
jgi:hypothetical protein